MTSQPEPGATPPRPTHTAARVVTTRPEGRDLQRVRIEPARPLTYVPGQVAALSLPGGERAYFAIASAPHEPGPLTFLIKDGGAGSPARALMAAEPETPIELDGPLGGGFDLSGADHGDVLLVGAGTGISPLRSVLTELLATPGRRGRLALVHGVRFADQLCFTDEQAAWRAAGVRVRLVVSRPEPTDRWQGRVGRVQRHLADLVTPRTVVYLAGMGIMIDETRATLAQLGVDPAQIRTNLG